jgi:hypothetical protein
MDPPADVSRFIKREIDTWGHRVTRLGLAGSQE